MCVVDRISEVDVPGHTASVAESYPDHVACAFLESWHGFGNEPPTGQLKLGSPAVQAFAEDISTTAAGLVSSRYFSTGGDEIVRTPVSAVFPPLINSTPRMPSAIGKTPR